MAVALDLVAERADHLAMTEVATLAHIDVAAGKLERRVGPHAFDLLDGRGEPEQGRDLEQAADGDDDENADAAGGSSSSRGLDVWTSPSRALAYSAGTGRNSGAAAMRGCSAASTGSSPRMVRHTL